MNRTTWLQDRRMAKFADVLGPVYIGYSGRDSQAPETLIQGWKMEVSLDSHGIEQRPMATDCT